VTFSLSQETKRLPPVTLPVVGEIVVVGVYPAHEVAASLLIAGDEHLPGLQDRVSERQGRGVQDPDVDGHAHGIFQFLLKRHLVSERSGCSAAVGLQEDADIDVAEGTVQKRPVYVGKENLLSIREQPGEPIEEPPLLLDGEVPGFHCRVIDAGDDEGCATPDAGFCRLLGRDINMHDGRTDRDEGYPANVPCVAKGHRRAGLYNRDRGFVEGNPSAQPSSRIEAFKKIVARYTRYSEASRIGPSGMHRGPEFRDRFAG